MFGCMLSALTVDIRLNLHKKPKYYISFGMIFVLLMIVFLGGEIGLFGKFGEPLELIHNYILLQYQLFFLQELCLHIEKYLSYIHFSQFLPVPVQEPGSGYHFLP